MTMTVFHKSGKCTQRAAPYNSGMTKVPPLPQDLCIHRKNHALLSRHYVAYLWDDSDKGLIYLIDICYKKVKYFFHKKA